MDDDQGPFVMPVNLFATTDSRESYLSYIGVLKRNQRKVLTRNRRAVDVLLDTKL